MDCNIKSPVLLLGLHYSSLQVSRSLGRKGIPIFGISENNDIIGKYSGYVKHVRVESTDEMYLRDFLLRYSHNFKSPCILFPLSDDYVLFLSKQVDSLYGKYLWPRIDHELVAKLIGKASSSKLFLKMGISHPKTILLEKDSSPIDNTIFNLLCYPCIIKPDHKHSWEANKDALGLIKNGQRAFLASSKSELMEFVQKNLFLGDLVIQEFIPGPCTNHYYYVGFRDRKGTLTTSFIGNKKRTLPDCRGSETVLVSASNPPLLSLGDSILDQLDYHGIAGIDFKFDERTNDYKVIEINCRIGINDGYLYKYGIDLPRFYYQDCLGIDLVPIKKYPLGIKWCDTMRDFDWMRDYRKKYAVSWFQWIAQTISADIYPIFDIMDIKPFFVAIATDIYRFFKKAISMITRRFR